MTGYRQIGVFAGYPDRTAFNAASNNFCRTVIFVVVPYAYLVDAV